jgi:chorismate mutase/prephenate dehydratase
MAKRDARLAALRKKIDALDAKIVQFLNERAKIVIEIGTQKKRDNSPVFSPEREKVVYDKVAKANSGPLSDECVKAVYRELMSGSLALEKPLKVAYLGPPGTFTHMAAVSKFGSSLDYVPIKDIEGVFLEVLDDRADYGVVPIENSIEGGITDTLDVFLDYDVKICSEIIMPIRQNLLANCRKEEIKRVYSKPQAFAQCRRWLSNNLPNAELMDVASTTMAARAAAKEKGAAAIASLEAAHLYGLKTVQGGIEDSQQNQTRFLVLAKKFGKRTGHDRTSLMVNITDRVGALYELLKAFRDEGINLTKIESRPSKRKRWEYYFFMDFAGHCEDKKAVRALKKLEAQCKHLVVLGSYPMADNS